MIRNETKTKEMQSKDKYIKFKEWIKQHGGKIDNIEYPVCWTPSGNLMGIGAAKDLGENELYLEIPEVLTFNRAKILKSPIGFIIEKHPEVFDIC